MGPADRQTPFWRGRKRLPPRGKLSPKVTDEGKPCRGCTQTDCGRELPPHPFEVGAADTFPQKGKAQTAKDFPAKNPGQLTVSRPGMCFYFAPRPAKTTYTVLNKIFTSFQSDQLSM